MKKTNAQALALIFCCLLFAEISSAQNESTAKWIGANLTFSLQPLNTGYKIVPEEPAARDRISYELTINNQVSFGMAFRTVGKNNWFQEYALTALTLKKDRDLTLFSDPDRAILEPHGGAEKTTFGLWLRYEYGRWFHPKTAGKKLNYALGLSLDPFMISHKMQPLTSSDYPYKLQQLGADTRLIPRIGYQIGPNILLELKFPVKFLSLYYEQQQRYNPLLEESDRRHRGVFFKPGFNDWQCALGLSLRL